MKEHLSNEEKKKLSYERQNAVRNAWKEEKARVIEGYGTRKWSCAEQEELLNRGNVSGYEGHHMKSVSLYPQYAGDSHNIQFLSEEEHLQGAHGGNYHNLTNGYYDPETQSMNEFGDELGAVPVYDLATFEKIESIDDVRSDYYEDAEKNGGVPNIEDIQDAKNSIEDSESVANSRTVYSEANGISNGRR